MAPCESMIGVLVTSICDKDPSALVTILGGPRAEPSEPCPGIQGFPYLVKTKYFTADIHLYACKDPADLTDEQLGDFESLVVFFDAKCDNFKEKISHFEHLQTKCKNSEINLAVCESCDNEQIKAMFADKLKSYEIIETESEEQEECGIERMIEAFKMHTWSNLVMHEREKLPGNPKLPDELFTGGTVPLNGSSEGASASGVSAEERESFGVVPPPPVEEEILGDVAFEDLFAKFAQLKTEARNLSGNDRKKFAEDVVTQFWKALGLDDAELDGLDSDDSDS